ncbi:MAG: ubiquinol-cytochrome c reductase iron-sulfur subunit [Acidobacteriota bacterium]
MTKPAKGITRRGFCQATGVSACAVATAGAGALTVDFLNPRVLFEPPTAFELGPPESFAVGDVVTNEQHRVFVIRTKEGFHALSSVCTHLGCITRFRPGEGIIACPCHGSHFDLAGDVTAGPAPRPLHWLEMKVTDRGSIQVDTAVEVPQGTVFKL